MHTCPPPYRPLRGAAPPHFVDRADGDDFGGGSARCTSIAAYRAGPRDPRFHRLVVAGPAMGKTALLRAIGQHAASELDWAVVAHRCGAKERVLGTVPAAAMAAMQRQWPADSVRLTRYLLGGRPRPAPAARRAAHPAGQALALVPRSPVPDDDLPWAHVRGFLSVSGRFARELSRGLLLIFDDVDRLGGTEVEALGHLARQLSQEDLPVAMLLSGGLDLADRFARLGNFSATVWPTHLTPFEWSEAREALVVPALDRRVDFDEDALDLACRAGGGRPLELQRIGFAAWSAATERGRVKIGDVEQAMGLLGFLGAGPAARAS